MSPGIDSTRLDGMGMEMERERERDVASDRWWPLPGLAVPDTVGGRSAQRSVELRWDVNGTGRWVPYRGMS